jgi:hypothetical protein
LRRGDRREALCDSNEPADLLLRDVLALADVGQIELACTRAVRA